jgi:prevent-host-death family protein
MKTIGAAEFKQKCLQILDELDPEGLTITKRGKPVARLLPARTGNGDLIGIAEGEVGAAEGDNLWSAGDWSSDEWDDASDQH